MTSPPRLRLPSAPGGDRGPGRRHRGETGAALVEFALVFPIFALLLFAMIQFGLVFTGWDQLRNDVQTGARLAAIGEFGTDTTCPQVDDFPGHQTSTQTAEIVCYVASLIGTPIGTAVSTSSPAQVGILISQDGLVTVCGRVQVQPFTGFFPSMTLSSTSEFYIEGTGTGTGNELQNYNPYGISSCN